MFQNQDLSDIFKSSSTVNTQSQIIAEWNQNSFDNIKKIGNYRYRPTVASPTESNFGVIASVFDENDSLGAYTNATDSDVVVDGGYNANQVPEVFLSQDVKKSLLYSLEDCFYKDRPRSGVNKILFFEGKKINTFSKDMFKRPRYYMASSDDKFKYWTSYRKELDSPQQKFFINNIKFSYSTVGSVNYYVARYTTSAAHGLKVNDTVNIKDTSSKDFNFLPKTYQVKEILSTTSFTVAETQTVYDEIVVLINNSQLSSDIIGNDGLAVAVSGNENVDVTMFVGASVAERGISEVATVDTVTANYISDAAPFIVYNNAVPANRIVVKMQTNVGSVNAGTFSNGVTTYNDPFYGDANKTVPKSWKIQYLDSSSSWVDLQTDTGSLELTEASVGSDGYLELSYGLIVPSEYTDIFIFAGELSSQSALPSIAPEGYSYLVKSGTGIGTFWIYTNDEWVSFDPDYGWVNSGDTVTRLTNYVTKLVNPDSFIDGSDTVFRELQYINGLRIVVESMNVNQSTFDLIELSPRLAVDLTERVTAVTVNKGSSNIGNSGILVDGVLVSTGDLEIFDFDNAFGEYNDESILTVKNTSNEIQYTMASKNLQVKVFDVVYTESGAGYHVPIKVMYADGFPDSEYGNRKVSITLRDRFAYLEATTATEVLYSNASMSFIVASLLDSIGFTNYIFKRVDDQDDPIIPYFFVKPNVTVAEVLGDLAVSTQTSVFFDEYNNLVFMSKEYMLPDSADRSVDYTFYGSKDSQKSADGIIKNERLGDTLANIVDISSRDNEIYNDGKITYSTRNVLKQYSSTLQASSREADKTWRYQQTLLWEVAPEANLRPKNDDNGNSGGYTLGAIPIKSALSSNLPTVVKTTITSATLDSITRDITFVASNQLTVGEVVSVINFDNNIFNVQNARVKSATATEFVVASLYKETMAADIDGVPKTGLTPVAININDNIIDFGEAGDWVTRYKGYYYAAGEIIKYDAVEYFVSGIGLVWISSPTEYKNYFSKLTFAGSIYPTGRIKIYAEPKYVGGVIQSGAVATHGRGQFGTTVTSHSPEISSSWLDPANKGACKMYPSYLFNLSSSIPVTSKTGAAGVAGTSYYPATTSIIKNVFARQTVSEKELLENKPINGTVQASALVMSGPTVSDVNYISYVHKQLEGRFNHFGTRMRIIGKSSTTSDGTQSTAGINAYITTNTTNDNKQVSVTGASAGIAVMNDKTTNIGYYMELVALTDTSLATSSSQTAQKVYNVLFYKIERGVKDETDNMPTGTDAFPIPLWAGQAPINTDEGDFAGMQRKSTDGIPTVYDIAVEYKEQSDGSLRFYLFMNNKVIAEVVDTSPIPNRPNAMSLFVRGKTKAMFENVYSLAINSSESNSKIIDAPVQSIFGYDKERATDALAKYGISGIVRDTYLSGISVGNDTKYNIYYDEFGTIMREMVYMDVKYDKAYPALYAKMQPTLSSFQNYVVSGFIANPYGARFMIFNSTDSALDLSLEYNSAYLRIGGVTFTSQSDNTLTVDSYFDRHADTSSQEIVSSSGMSVNKYKADYASIKNSRLVYGKKEFSLNAPYIQTQDTADEMMGWMINRIMKPRKSIGIRAFANPMLQLGDIVTIDYKDSDNNDIIATSSERFVIYHIEYKRGSGGPEMTVFLSEVV